MNENTNNKIMEMPNDEATSSILHLQKLIDESHRVVSAIVTPKEQIFTNQGFDYVQLGYMKKIADKYYSGWSFKIIKYEFVGQEAVCVHGRLKWCDLGVWREGDMLDSHDLMKKRDTGKIINIGNTLKAAVTDCMKKTLNTYLNIADDVYKKSGEFVSEKQKEDMIALSRQLDKKTQTLVFSALSKDKITPYNYEEKMNNLRKKINENKTK